MSVSDYGENKLLDKVLKGTDFTIATPYAALHTGAPAETGANEVTGGSYARQLVAASGWNAASGGLSDNVAAISWTNLPACTLFGVSIWDAATAGNCWLTGWLATVRKIFVCTDTTNDLIRSPSHGLVADDRVAFAAEDAGSLPAGLDNVTCYYVIASGLATDDFKVSTTQGGAAFNITGVGSGKLYKVVPQVINAGGTFQINAGNLDLLMF